MSRPFHFTVDPFAVPTTWTKIVDPGSQSWTIVNTTELKGVSPGGEALIVRNTDTADQADVQSRMKRVGLCEYGIIANFQDNNNYYLWFAQTSAGRFALFRKTGGSFFTLGTHVVSPPNNTFKIMRLETINTGPNKTLKAYLDGVNVITSVISNFIGAEQAGIRMFAFGGECRTDWWTLNTVLGINSVTPNAGPPVGGDNVSINGTDFGDSALVFFDNIAATSVVITPTTTITCDTPAHDPGKVDVDVKFGTAGSEEFTATLVDGFTYGGLKKLINQSKTLGRRLISSNRS